MLTHKVQNGGVGGFDEVSAKLRDSIKCKALKPIRLLNGFKATFVLGLRSCYDLR